MTASTLLNRYKEDAIITTPKEQLILKLYEGALRNLNRCLDGLNRDDRARFGHYLGKAQAIVAELLNSLDHSVTPPITQNLEKLYLFVIESLMNANLSKNAEGVHRSIRILSTLKEGWDHAVRETCGQTV